MIQLTKWKQVNLSNILFEDNKYIDEKNGKKSNVIINTKFRMTVTSVVEAYDQSGPTVAFWDMVTVLWPEW